MLPSLMKTRYEIVVAADGQESRTRRLNFGEQVSDEAFKPLGVHAAYYNIPRIEGEGGLARSYSAPGRRFVITRTGDRPLTQVYLFTMKDTERLKLMSKEPIEKQKKALAGAFKDAGWQFDRLLGALDTCEDFYSHEIGQVKMKQLHHGRVVLLGDAGYCPSPSTGMGTTAALVGSYVAGELARHDSVTTAFKAYDGILRSPVEDWQKNAGAVGAFFSSSQLGVWMLRKAMWAVSSLKIDQMMHRFLSEGKDTWNALGYLGLNLVS